MSALEEHLKKLREDRVAREKARIEKLKELNLKKYNKTDSQSMLRPASSNLSVNKSTVSVKSCVSTTARNFTARRPNTVPVPFLKPNIPKKDGSDKRKTIFNVTKTTKPTNIVNTERVTIGDNKNKFDPKIKTDIKVNTKSDIPKFGQKLSKPIVNTQKNLEKKTDDKKIVTSVLISKERSELRKTLNFGYNKTTVTQNPVNKPVNARKSMLPQGNSRKSMLPTAQNTKVTPNRQSVFERLYQPKPQPKKVIDDVTKLKTDPEYLKKLMKSAEMLTKKRHTIHETRKPMQPLPIRRSISAIHFKKISKSELSNCMHKWSSIGEKLNESHLLKDEDEKVKQDKVVSAVKSERKKVKFQTPVYLTPKPEELQSRLQAWLQKRGKSLTAYQHLQCFGIHHLPNKIQPLQLDEPNFDFNDEDKENQPLEHDSDNESFDDNMNDKDVIDEDIDEFNDEGKNKWRNASVVNDSVDFNDTNTEDMTLTSTETPIREVNELLLGALTDLTELLHEGFDWEQCARWLRAVRERFPYAPETAAYWECRAALEERRGDLPTTIHCWEEAVAKGTKQSVVEANLDQLLDKFMQLKISPSGAKKQVDPKMIDVKNIFKSTIILFAVQKAKLRQSIASPTTKYICTPVRRSARLSKVSRTPLQVCSSVKQASQLAQPITFVPNDKICGTP